MQRIPTARWVLAAGIVAGWAACAAVADEKTDALLARARQALEKAQSLQGEFTRTLESGDRKNTLSGTFRLLRPNLAEVRINGADGSPVQVVASDGKTQHTVLYAQKQFLKGKADPAGRGLGSILGPLGNGFFAPATLGGPGMPTYAGQQKVDGRTYEVVQFKSTARAAGGDIQQTLKLFLTEGGLPEGYSSTSSLQGRTSTMSLWVKNLKTDAALKPEQFAYAPPADFKPYEPPNYEAGLVEVGKPAPSFALSQPGGNLIKLEDMLKGRKAVLLNFWFYG